MVRSMILRSRGAGPAGAAGALLAALLSATGFAEADEPSPGAADGGPCVTALDVSKWDGAAQKELVRLSKSGGVVVFRSTAGEACPSAATLVPYCIGTGVVYQRSGGPSGQTVSLPAGTREASVTLEGVGCPGATHVATSIELACSGADCDAPLRVTLMPKAGPPAEAKVSGGTAPAKRGLASPWPLVVGGVGLAAVGGGIALRLAAAAAEEDLSDCKRTGCPESRTSPIDTQNVLGIVFASAGVAALAGAVVWYVLENPEPPTSAKKTTSLRFAPTAYAGGGAGVVLGGIL